MNNKQYTIVFIIALILLLSGVYNTFNFWWGPKTEPPFYCVFFSFFCFGGSSLLFSAFFSYLFFVPKNIKYNLFTQNNNKEIKNLQNQIGKSKARKIIIAWNLLFVLIFILFGFFMLFILGKHEKYQLQNFGKEQVIEISEITKGYKGVEVAVVNYEYDGKLYSKEFYLKKYKTGEKVSILFSTHNPNIAVWKDEFKTNNK